MPTPIAKGIIIAVSVAVAAGLAAYESPQVQQWIQQSRHRIAMALHSLGDDIHPRSRSPRQSDASMQEDRSEEAEARRRRAREEILERGRIMQERKKRRKSSRSKTPNASFDDLVDKNGLLRKDYDTHEHSTEAFATSVEPAAESRNLVDRHHKAVGSLDDSVDSPIALRQLKPRVSSSDDGLDPFASSYEHEMRNAWNMPLPAQAETTLSSHASESLLDLTPTSEAVPDPDISVPDIALLSHPDRSEYFSAAASASSHTLSNDERDYYYAHPQNPLQPLPARMIRQPQMELPSVSSAPSIAGSTDHVRASEFDDSSDGVLSDFGDGIRTPASAWTEVDSNVSDEGLA